MPMAPTAGSTTANANKPVSNGNFDSFQSWLEIYGNAEYVLYKRAAAPPHLSYEDWVSSEHPLGPYLYHLTLEAWDEVSSSDEHIESPVKPAQSVQLGRGSTKKATTNGNKTSHTVDFATPAPGPKTDEPVSSSKRRRRSKKKILSEERISSEDGNESATLPADTKPEKSGASIKKQKLKKQTTTSIIPPEDIEESTPVANAVTPTGATAAASPDGPSSSSAPRRGLRIRTPAQQRPYLHHEKLFDELVKTGQPNESNNKRISQPSSKLALVSYPNSATEDQLDDEDSDVLDSELEGIEERRLQPGRKFKGKGRAWKKEESDEDTEYHQENKAKNNTKKTANRRKSRQSDVRLSDNPYGTNDETPETSPIEQKERTRSRQRKSHKSEEFVKDDSSDIESQAVAGAEEPKRNEGDDEVMVDSPYLAERPKRKPRKSYLSQEFVGDDSDSDLIQPAEEIQEPLPEQLGDPATVQCAQSKPKQRRKPRKHLSEEFIRDDTESDTSQVAHVTEPIEITPANSVPASSAKSSPKNKLKPTEQTNTQQPSGVLESKGQNEDQENMEALMNSSVKKGRKRKTGSSDSLGSITN